jgi:acyl-CoA hydrolase
MVRNFVPLAEGYFTMVAQKQDGGPIDLPKLCPETTQEYEWYLLAQSKRPKHTEKQASC